MFKTEIIDGICINTAMGEYTFSGLLEYIEENIHLWERIPVVWNLTQVSLGKTDDGADMIRMLLSGHKELAKLRTSQRTAFAIQRDYDYGMFRMLCTLAECLEYPFELRPFRSLEEGQDWVKSDM